jgi:hypothetical protein
VGERSQEFILRAICLLGFSAGSLLPDQKFSTLCFRLFTLSDLLL